MENIIEQLDCQFFVPVVGDIMLLDFWNLLYVTYSCMSIDGTEIFWFDENISDYKEGMNRIYVRTNMIVSDISAFDVSHWVS